MSYADTIAETLVLDDSKPAKIVAAVLGELQSRRGFEFHSFDPDVLREMGETLTAIVTDQLKVSG